MQTPPQLDRVLALVVRENSFRLVRYKSNFSRLPFQSEPRWSCLSVQKGHGPGRVSSISCRNCLRFHGWG